MGFGLFSFISTLQKCVKDTVVKTIKVDFSEVISRNQVEDRFRSDTGLSLNSLALNINADAPTVYFCIIEKIRPNIDPEALNYLLNIPEVFGMDNKNVFFIFSSSASLTSFSHIHIRLSTLSLHETSIILQAKYGNRFTANEVSAIHERSEGVIKKLEQIMSFLEWSSAQEVLLQDDIFDDYYYSDSIPSTTLKQIAILTEDPDKNLTFKMLKILSVLKNGESLSNLRRDPIGIHFGPRNSRDLVNLELASTIFIDGTTTIVKINPLIKDYVLSIMTQEEIDNITNAYLPLSIIETQDGIRLSTTGRKIFDKGYNSEEDNANTLLRNAIEQCKKVRQIQGDVQVNEIRLKKLLYLSEAYIYGLHNSSRYNETISASQSLISVTTNLNSADQSAYYYYLSSAMRMLSDLEGAKQNIEIARSLCEPEDKTLDRQLFVQELRIFSSTDKDLALAMARKGKQKYRSNTEAFIVSEEILASVKPKGERILALEKLERKARRLEFHTLANNILLMLNEEKEDAQKMTALDTVFRTDNNSYNICRATVSKYEVLVRTGMFGRINDSDVDYLMNVYNYLFRQKFDNLFKRCHDTLWKIAEYKKQKEMLFLIFYKGMIVWKLNSDEESEDKYNELFNQIVPRTDILTPTINDSY